MNYDYKKEFKALYQPQKQPSVIDVPQMVFIQIDGRGNPNVPDGAYKKAVETLYALSYTIKMLPKSGQAPEDYFSYVVPPLEGLWWLNDDCDFDFSDKTGYCWTSMIRQPEFVTDAVFERACAIASAKKPHLKTTEARLLPFAEGLCVQCMHYGPYDEEPATLASMKRFADAQGLLCDISDTRRHHEIYLSDPRKTDRAKIRTILRIPVKQTHK